LKAAPNAPMTDLALFHANCAAQPSLARYLKHDDATKKSPQDLNLKNLKKCPFKFFKFENRFSFLLNLFRAVARLGNSSFQVQVLGV
jgi:hypothetical protein